MNALFREAGPQTVNIGNAKNQSLPRDIKGARFKVENRVAVFAVLSASAALGGS
jgi:hypothetical protein